MDGRGLRNSTPSRGHGFDLGRSFSSWHGALKELIPIPDVMLLSSAVLLWILLVGRPRAALMADVLLTSPVGMGSQGAVSSTRGGGSSVWTCDRFQAIAAAELWLAGVRRLPAGGPDGEGWSTFDSCL